MPAQAQNNQLTLNPIYDEISKLCPIELSLVTLIIPFMFIVNKHRGGQNGLRGQSVLVPSDLKKVQQALKLPRPFDEGHIISLALKRRLSDKSAIEEQHIQPALVNAALRKLKEVNHFYKNVEISQSWEQVSELTDRELWDMLTKSDDIIDDVYVEDLDSNLDTDLDETSNENENEITMQEADDTNGTTFKDMVIFPTVLHEIDGVDISVERIVNIAPAEGQIPVSTFSEPNWEALAYVKQFSEGNFHYGTTRDVKITASKYAHARLKCADNRFASDPQYIFGMLNWIERETISSTIHFAGMKRRQAGPIQAKDIQNRDTFRSLLSDAELYSSFKSIRGTPQYFHDMMLDVLAKVRQYGAPTFWLTFSADDFGWTDIIKITAPNMVRI